MADLFCSFLDSRSLTTNYQILLPPKPFCTTFVPTILHCHPRTGRRRRKLLHLSLLSEPKSTESSSSSDTDVIAIHEHSDGSLLFRFGDPSEIAENEKPEEPKMLKEITEESQEGFNTVNFLDGDTERKVNVKKLDKEVIRAGLAEVANKGNSIVSSKESISAVETESKPSQKLSEDSEKVELEINKDNSIGVNNESTSIAERDNESSEKLAEELEKVEIAMDKANSVGISNESISTVERENELTEKLSEDKQEVELPVPASSTDKKDSCDHSEDTKDDGSSNADTGYMEEDSSQKHEDEISPLVNPTVIEESSNVNNSAAATEFTEEKIEGEMILQSVPLKPDPDSDAIVEIFTKESTGETIAATDVSAKNQSIEAGRKLDFEDGKINDTSEVTSVSPHLELSTSLSADTGDQNSEIGQLDAIIEVGNTGDTNDVIAFPVPAIDFSTDSEDQSSEATIEYSEDTKDHNLEAGDGTPSQIIEDGSQSEIIEDVMQVSPQLEAEPTLDEEADNDSMEESAVADGSERVVMTNDDHSERSGDFVEASEQEVTEMEPIESVASRVGAVFVLSSGAALFPQPSKVLTGGEDAYFISGQNWIGVADGVSQWSLEGVNPGVFAQELVKNCENIISDSTGESVNIPVEVLKRSVARTQSPGSSTFLIAHFDGQALHVANIGDSGFILLRHGTVYKKSSPMLHGFHFPVQTERGDDPSSLIEEYRVDLEEGDVIITATDGFFDNLYDQEISSIVSAAMGSDKGLEEIAKLLATRAQKVGRSASAKSPFADAAQAAGYVGYTGGKLDDVAVIVSVVQKQ